MENKRCQVLVDLFHWLDLSHRKRLIDYYEPVHFPITQYETVEELLEHSEKASKAVGQEYVINAFDLGVCMKALPLVWKYPDQYWKHIIFPGPFHTKMNFIGMLTKKKARESGYAEILIEVKLVTSGTLVRVLSGKASLKALFNLKAGVEALEWSLCQRKWYWNPPRSFTESHQLHAHSVPVVNSWMRSFKASQLPTLPTNTKNFK